ncbi:ABC transporter substrate-binding protein [Candidatus Pelagibacter sp.]|uniref:ABC transporter substrate-binding protein n=1 Tax=Candidatus Pelagibacter sp. TaxID=2024849 RepID=UPI003F8663F6
MKKIFRIIFTLIIIYLTNHSFAFSQNEKIKIGLLAPLSGEYKKLGQSIIKSTRMALSDIGTDNIEIYPMDTGIDPNQTLQSATALKNEGIKIFIGPIFFKSLMYLDEIQDVIFLSLTNKTNDLPKNVISSGVNSLSQLNAIKDFLELSEVNKTIFLTPDLDYKNEIKKAIKQSKIKIFKQYTYETEPTKLTKQIEKITNYDVRKQNLADEILRVENSDLVDKEKQIKKLEKRYTIGNVNFDSVIISDFDENLKSVITSLIYTDVSPRNKLFITLNQWFDESLLLEENIQPLYYPSINKQNLETFNKKFVDTYNSEPNHLSLLSYDLLGLIYYLSLKSDFSDVNNIFKKENSFKGKIGIFDVKNNKINHRLNFYKIDRGEIKEIF